MSKNHAWFVFGEVAVQPTRYGTILVDAAALPSVARFRWHVRAGKLRYVRAWVEHGRETIYLHHLLLTVPAGEEVDFRNGNTLDCRRENIRLADRSENNCNRNVSRSNSGFLGVHYCRQRRKWVAQIKFRGRHKSLGRFDNLSDAVCARDAAARAIHGEFSSDFNKHRLVQEATLT